MRIDTPAPYQGTKEEQAVNQNSHQWQAYDSDVYCVRCDSRPGGISANYPCGADIPRTTKPISPHSAFRFIN